MRSAADHPWLAALDAFSIPFLLYGGRRDRVYASAAVGRVLGDTQARAGVEWQADRLAAEESLARLGPAEAPFQLARRVPAASAPCVLDVYVARRGGVGGISVVVVLAASEREHAGADDPVGAGLSARRSEVAALIAAGLSTKEIAGRLQISSHTVRHHTEKIFSQLGVRTRAGVAGVLVRSHQPAPGPLHRATTVEWPAT